MIVYQQRYRKVCEREEVEGTQSQSVGGQQEQHEKHCTLVTYAVCEHHAKLPDLILEVNGGHPATQTSVC